MNARIGLAWSVCASVLIHTAWLGQQHQKGAAAKHTLEQRISPTIALRAIADTSLKRRRPHAVNVVGVRPQAKQAHAEVPAAPPKSSPPGPAQPFLADDSAPPDNWDPRMTMLGLDDFAPSLLLDQQPQPVSDIAFSPPAGSAAVTGRHLIQLTLLIDEAGLVVEAIADFDTSAPQAYVDVARQAFTQARFAPGMQGQKPVRSRMRVEVSFDEMHPASRQNPSGN